MTDDPERDSRQRLLESVLSGERSLADSEVQMAMRADERFACELVELLALQATLSRQAADVQADLAHSDPELESVVESALRSRGRRGAALVRGWRWLLAVAAILAVLTLAWPRGQAPKPSPYLGGAIKVEQTDGGHSLTFGFVLPTEGWFVVTVQGPNGRLGAPVEVRTPTWTPDRALVATWPDAVTIVVAAFDRDGQSIATGRVDWQIR